MHNNFFAFLLDALKQLSESVLFASCLFILLGSVFITIKTRFVQLRLFSMLFQMLKGSFLTKEKGVGQTIAPHKALFTAMSTTLGISTIVAPVIAINLGGPGALLGFLLTCFFGSAATFVEVNLSMRHRKQLPSGAIMGGPMQYIGALFSPRAAKCYAFCCLILMTVWSSGQANQLAAILDSPLLGNYRIPTFVSGGFLAVFILIALLGGIRRIGSFSEKLVPLMFCLYVGSSLWILLCNVDHLGAIFYAMIHSLFTPYAMASGTLVGGVVTALRWGIFKGIQTCEAGVGTQAIPHSMAETKDPIAQGALAMLSTYVAGIVAFLSGCVALVTKTWENQDIPLGISMVASSFQLYFSSFGVAIVAVSTLLFGFGTILGNGYNGSQCFGYLTQNKNIRYYLVGMGVMVFIGAIGEVKMIWSMMDLVLAAIAVPHMALLLLQVAKEPKIGYVQEEEELSQHPI